MSTYRQYFLATLGWFFQLLSIIDKNDKQFEDIMDQVKRRQVTTTLLKVLKSDNVILLHSLNPLPKALKVFCVKDILKDNKYNFL